MVRVPEVDRRQTHISEIDPTNPLLPIALDCLNDQDIERPSAQQLCERVLTLKGQPQYSESLKIIQVSGKQQQKNNDAQHVGSLQQIVQLQTIQLEEKDHAISQKNEENQQLRQQDSEKDEIFQEKNVQLGRVNQQLEMSERMISFLQKRITELEQRLSQRGLQHQEAGRDEISNGIRLKWREEERSKREMNIRYAADAVVDGTTVYMIFYKEVYAYEIDINSWCEQPQPLSHDCPLAFIYGLLTTVGGQLISDGNRVHNELFSLNKDKQWIKKFPNMPTYRQSSTALCTGTSLIVAGGRDKSKKAIRTIEVMNTETHQWSTAADLPVPRAYSSAAVCGDSVYMLGGDDDKEYRRRSVYTCTLSALIQSCQPTHLNERKDRATVWSRLADFPLIAATCVSLNGRLLAIGGLESNDQPAATVHMYIPATDSWQVIAGHMYTARSYCYAAVLPDNQLIVVGGTTKWIKQQGFYMASRIDTDSVEHAVMM